MRRGRVRIGLALAALLALPGCERPSAPEPAPPSPDTSPSTAPSASAEPTTFRYGLEGLDSLLPGDAAEPGALVVADTLYDSLTSYAPEGGVRQAAAVAWRADEGGRVWTFTLRPDAIFSDGAPVTAEDFVFGWSLAAARGRAGYHLEEVEGYAAVREGSAPTLSGLTAPDPRTLVVRLSTPQADFPSVAAHPALAPVPRARYEADPITFGQLPIGNGPFTVSAWDPGSFLRVTRSDTWRTGAAAPALAEILFRFSDAETAYVAFQQERYDYAPLPPGAMAEARERYGTTEDGLQGPGVLDGPAPQLYFLGVNHTVAPFDRVEVRRALSLAIDREALAAAVREGNADPALGAVPRALLRGEAREACSACRLDADEARRLFEEAGVTDLELWLSRDGGHEQIGRLLRQQLADAGVAVRIRLPPEGEPFSAYLDRLRSGEAALFRFGWTADYPTLDDAVTPLFSGALAGQDGAGNYGRYAAPDVDALLGQARSTLNAAERRRLYQVAEELALDRDQAIIPLLTFRYAAVVSDRFTGFVLNPLGLPDLAAVSPAPPS
jgi:ABC-type transport system substrate-binding protein